MYEFFRRPEVAAVASIDEEAAAGAEPGAAPTAAPALEAEIDAALADEDGAGG